MQIKIPISIFAFTVPVGNSNKNNYIPSKQETLRVFLDKEFKENAETSGLRVERVKDKDKLKEFFKSL